MFHQTLYVPTNGVTFPQDEMACYSTNITRCDFVRANGEKATVEIKSGEVDEVLVGKKRKRKLPGRGTLTYAELKSAIAELWQLNATFCSENERLKVLNEKLHAELRQRHNEYEEELSRLKTLLKDIIDSRM